MSAKDSKVPVDHTAELGTIAAEVAEIAKTPAHQRTAQQNERLQALEKSRHALIPPPAPPAPPADADKDTDKPKR